MGERIKPGAMALMRMLLLAYVAAADRASASMAPLQAAMARD